MVWCNHCRKNVPGERVYDAALACNLCGRILENFNFSSDVTFVKNAAGQSQASGNIVRSVQSGNSSSRDRRIRIARDEFMNLRDALRIGDERDDLIDIAVRFFRMALDHNFTKGRRSDLVLSSCLYLTCRKFKNIAVLLIDFSSYLRVSVYELGSVYLQFCEMLHITENQNYEKLVDPSIYIQRFTNMLLKGADNKKEKEVVKTARDIITSMKRDWMQTGRKPSGICGAALYIAARCHDIMCTRSDIGKIVHMCEATVTKRLIEFANTESASLNVDDLTEREEVLREKPFTPKPNSEKGGVKCMHKDCEPFGCGLCESCYKDFIKVCGGLEGGSDPPAFQRAEKERREEKEGREEKDEGGVGSLNHDEVSDESVNLSDADDSEVDNCFLNEEEKRVRKMIWDLVNHDYDAEQAAKEAAALNASNNAANCPENERNLVEASKAAVAKSRKETRQKRAEEAKKAPPPATAMEAVCRTLERKRLSGFNYDDLEELFDPCPQKKSRTETETVTEKKEEHEMNTDENIYVDEVEEEEDGYDFGLY